MPSKQTNGVPDTGTPAYRIPSARGSHSVTSGT